jgi:hypothetical protein
VRLRPINGTARLAAAGIVALLIIAVTGGAATAKTALHACRLLTPAEARYLQPGVWPQGQVTTNALGSLCTYQNGASSSAVIVASLQVLPAKEVHNLSSLLAGMQEWVKDPSLAGDKSFRLRRVSGIGNGGILTTGQTQAGGTDTGLFWVHGPNAFSLTSRDVGSGAPWIARTSEVLAIGKQIDAKLP